MKLHTGIGYDVHRLIEGRRLIIGGVDIPYEKGLFGHSDADVLLHAISDALLGAAALGDIGKLFPDSDPAYEGADSLVLLSKTVLFVKENGWDIENIDSVIVAQKPKMSDHIDQMRANISKAADIGISDISVKATTEEGLGFTGDGSAISAFATVLLKKE